MNSPTVNAKELELLFSSSLSDYVTALAWSPKDKSIVLSATSAAGEVVLWQNSQLTTLQNATENGESVNCVAFSYDGVFLAAGGQDGRVKIWRDNELITTLDNTRTWVDKLAWSPNKNWLAFSVGSRVQVWDAESTSLIATVDFEESSPLSIDWRKDGQYLAIGGNKGLKIWDSQDWDDEPYVLYMPTVSLAMTWSPDGNYLASANMDRSITVLQWGNPEPWVMSGFPGKIRQLSWSDISTNSGAPLLACSSVEGVVVWEKFEDDGQGWEARILTNHLDIIQDIAFAPKSFLLASGASDGWLCLWGKAKKVSQILTGVEAGFSCLAWHHQGQLLAAGGDNGELFIWSKA